MKLVLMADNHNYYDDIKVPDGDVLIHAGDYSGMGTIPELVTFNKWLGSLPHVCKIFVPGNHDGLFETDQPFAMGLLNNAITLIDNEFVWKGIKFYGTPCQPFFNNWHFNVSDEAKRTETFDKIPDTTNVLITHCPPYGILDKTKAGEYCGDPILKNRISYLRALRLNVFGHIHEASGTKRLAPVTYANASVTDEKYNLTKQPIVFEI